MEGSALSQMCAKSSLRCDQMIPPIRVLTDAISTKSTISGDVEATETHLEAVAFASWLILSADGIAVLIAVDSDAFTVYSAG